MFLKSTVSSVVLVASVGMLGGCDLALDLVQDQLISAGTDAAVNALTTDGSGSTNQQPGRPGDSGAGPEVNTQELVAVMEFSINFAISMPTQEMASNIIAAGSMNPNAWLELREAYSAAIAAEGESDKNVLLLYANLFYSQNKPQEMQHIQILKDVLSNDSFKRSSIDAAWILNKKIGIDRIRSYFVSVKAAYDTAWPQLAGGRPAPAPMMLTDEFESLASSIVDLTEFEPDSPPLSVVTNVGSETEKSNVPSTPDVSKSTSGTLIGFTLGTPRMPVFKRDDSTVYTFDEDGQQIDASTMPWSPAEK